MSFVLITGFNLLGRLASITAISYLKNNLEIPASVSIQSMWNRIQQLVGLAQRLRTSQSSGNKTPVQQTQSSVISTPILISYSLNTTPGINRALNTQPERSTVLGRAAGLAAFIIQDGRSILLFLFITSLHNNSGCIDVFMLQEVNVELIEIMWEAAGWLWIALWDQWSLVL